MDFIRILQSSQKCGVKHLSLQPPPKVRCLMGQMPEPGEVRLECKVLGGSLAEESFPSFLSVHKLHGPNYVPQSSVALVLGNWGADE